MTIHDTLDRVAPTRPAAGTPEWATLLVVLAGTFMITLDFFIVNVAIPDMQRQLGATAGQVQWIVAGYSLAIAAGVITAGRLGDLFGRRRVYAIGIALFTLASLACGVSATAGELVTARVLQGIAAALLTPQVLAIIMGAFSGKSLARAFTAYGLSMGVAAVFGQLIGGLLIHADIAGLGWRSCFLINLPIGAVVLVLVPRLVPRSSGTGTARLDTLGMMLVTAALVACVLPLIEGQASGWPLWTFGSFVASAVLFAAFVVYQIRLQRRGDAAPLIAPSMFAPRGFRVGILAQLVFWAGQGSFFLVLALYLQQTRGLSALGAGVVFTAIGAGYLLTSSVADRIAVAIGRQTVAIGALMMVVGLVALQVAVRSIGTGGSIGWLVPGLAIDGAGMGIALSPLAATVLAYVPARLAGAASGVLSTVMQVGGAVGIAVIGIVFYRPIDVAGGAPAAYPHAFALGLTFLAVIEAAVVVLTQLLPRSSD
ncbi:MAG TPA: MFS transporter [Micromonosporaceae bacterium]